MGRAKQSTRAVASARRSGLQPVCVGEAPLGSHEREREHELQQAFFGTAVAPRQLAVVLQRVGDAGQARYERARELMEFMPALPADRALDMAGRQLTRSH